MAYGEYQKAQPLAERALSSAKKNDAPDSEMSSCLIDLAWLYRYQGKLSQARDFCQEGLQLQQKALSLREGMNALSRCSLLLYVLLNNIQGSSSAGTSEVAW